MPLGMMEVGVKRKIRKVGGRDKTKRFLESLGFAPGAEVSVVSELGGNMIVNVKDSRVAIDSELARCILV